MSNYKTMSVRDYAVYANKNVDFKPSWQRRSVWTIQQIMSFINTLIGNGPIGLISMAVVDDTPALLDAKQRSETILKLLSGKIVYDYDKVPKDERGYQELDGLTFTQFPEKFKNKVLNYELVIWSRTMSSDDAGYWFRILNTRAEKVNNEEIRNSLCPNGNVNTIKKSIASHDYWDRIFSDKRKNRMAVESFINKILYLVVTGTTQDRDKGLSEFITSHENSSSIQLKEASETILKYLAILDKVLPAKAGRTNFYKDNAQYTLFHLLHNELSKGYRIKDAVAFKERLELIQRRMNAVKREEDDEDILDILDSLLEGPSSKENRRKRLNALRNLVKDCLVK